MTKQHIVKRVTGFALALAFAAGLSACGQRGPLVPPGAAATDTPEGKTVEQLSPDTPTAETPTQTPDKDFLLDALL